MVVLNPKYQVYTNHKVNNNKFITTVTLGHIVMVNIVHNCDHMLINGFVTSITMRGVEVRFPHIGSRFVKWYNVRSIENKIQIL